MTWCSSTPGYGPAEEYKAQVFSASVPVSEAVLWQDRMIDITGFYYFGARYYDPVAARFLSPDPKGHTASMDLYSDCNGDPVNGVDPDMRFALADHNGPAGIVAGGLFGGAVGRITMPNFSYTGAPSPAAEERGAPRWVRLSLAIGAVIPAQTKRHGL